jgi:hypothetical protein
MTISFLTLTIFFLFSSFAFGCTENWAVATCEVILFLGAGISGFIDKDFIKWPKKLNIFALFVAFLILVSLIQLIPFPISFWNVIDKSRIQMYEDGAKAEELLQSEKYRIDPFEKSEIPYESERYSPQLPQFLTITRTPIATFRAVIALLSFFCFILLLEDVLRQGNSELRKLALLVGLIGFAIGIIALVEKGIEHRTHILWIRESARAQNAFGPFVNANHGEAFINLTFPILCYLISRKAKRENNLSEKMGLILITISLLILQFFLVASGFSYGNFLGVVLTPLVFLFHFSFRTRNKWIFIFSILCAISIISFGSFLVFEGAFSYVTKANMFKNALQNLSLCGVGMNSFQDTFPSKIVKWPIFFPVRLEYLENEYLQIFYEGGLAAFIFGFFSAFTVLKIAVKKIFSKGSVFWVSIPLIAETIRISFDMSFHIYPLAGTFLLLVGLCLQENR